MKADLLAIIRNQVHKHLTWQTHIYGNQSYKVPLVIIKVNIIHINKYPHKYP